MVYETVLHLEGFVVLGVCQDFLEYFVRSVCFHSVEVMVYQYDKLFGYGCWMTSILTMN